MALNVVTRGFGPSASIPLVVTRGFFHGEAVEEGSSSGVRRWYSTEPEFDKKKFLHLRKIKQRRQLESLRRQIDEEKAKKESLEQIELKTLEKKQVEQEIRLTTAIETPFRRLDNQVKRISKLKDEISATSLEISRIKSEIDLEKQFLDQQSQEEEMVIMAIMMNV